ncbi:MAG TPA: zinc ribbon domain-containing protein [Gemmatimonadaceae bacterium]|nr:zinc ribbon domain-containing protein [Gemmatimonadaceae bacterium]
MTSPTSPASDGDTIACPACHAQASGKFCSNCGAALSATKCAACGAELRPGAKFCHRCGTPAGAEGTGDQRSFNSALPWSVAAIALLAFVALVAGQRFGRSQEATPTPTADANAAPFAGGGGQPPDISNMSPTERAERLYNRIMAAHENGHADTVAMFAPMAIQAYQALDSLDLDARYDMGRIAAISGDEQLARAEADTILAKHPNHLLGLILAGNAAHMRKDAAAERSFHDKLVASAASERAKNLPEYTAHDNDIVIALNAKQP